MISDTLILECPECKEQFPVTVYSGNCSGNCSGMSYGIENAPLKIIAEVNDLSKRSEIACIHCGVFIAVQVLYISNVRPLSSCEREGWKNIKGVNVT